MTALEQMGAAAKDAAGVLATAGSKKDTALLGIASALENRTREILAQNDIDLANGKAAGLTPSLLDRLALSPARISDIADGIRQIVAMTDPVGSIISGSIHKNGMEIKNIRVPLGVIGIIYEARPNVTADAAALCLKAGNAVILRGGKEAFNSNNAITNVMREAVVEAGLPADCIQLVQDTSRESATELMRLSKYLDVLIPRGGAGLIKAVVENSKVPVIETGTGNCHIYVDKYADLEMAASITFNAKTSRPSVCNAAESLLVHESVAREALPKIKAMLDTKNVKLKGCQRTAQVLGDSVEPASEEDWATEFLDYIMSVKIVDSIEEAIAHINKYSSGHSECIVTDDYANAMKFTRGVDSAAVYVNASTRYTDGGEFGLGAEIGISTQKLHARGPMGLNQLTSAKFVIYGNGQIR